MVKRSKVPKILVIIFILLLLAGLGFLGYTYKKTNDTVKVKSIELSKAYQSIESLEKSTEKLKSLEAAEKFIKEQNNEKLSRQMCGGTPVGVFDVHINEKFAVFRYLCSELTSGAPIRIGALKKLDNGTYEFTYGSSDDTPNNLPSYIFDTDAKFFTETYKAIRY